MLDLTINSVDFQSANKLLATVGDKSEVFNILERYFVDFPDKRLFVVGYTVFKYSKVYSIVDKLVRAVNVSREVDLQFANSLKWAEYRDLYTIFNFSTDNSISNGFFLADEVVATPTVMLQSVVPVQHGNGSLDFWDQLAYIITNKDEEHDGKGLFSYGLQLLHAKAIKDGNGEEECAKLIKIFSGDMNILNETLAKLICEHQKIDYFLYNQINNKITSSTTAVAATSPSTEKIVFLGLYHSGLRIMLPHSTILQVPTFPCFTFPARPVFTEQVSTASIFVADLADLPTVIRNCKNTLMQSGFKKFVFSDSNFKEQITPVCTNFYGGWTEQSLKKLSDDLYILEDDVYLNRFTFDHMYDIKPLIRYSAEDEMMEDIMEKCINGDYLCTYMRYKTCGVLFQGKINEIIFSSKKNLFRRRKFATPGKTAPYIMASAGISLNKLCAEDRHEARVIIVQKGAGSRLFYILPAWEYSRLMKTIQKKIEEKKVPLGCPNWIGHQILCVGLPELRRENFAISRVEVKAGEMLILAPGAVSFGANLDDTISLEFSFYVPCPKEEAAYQYLCNSSMDEKVSEVHIQSPKFSANSLEKVVADELYQEVVNINKEYEHEMYLLANTHKKLNIALDHLQCIGINKPLDTKFRLWDETYESSSSEEDSEDD